MRTAIALGLLGILAGIALLAVPGEDTARAVGAIAGLGLGGIAIVAAVFYAVGRSEDRDRAAGRH